MSTAEPAALQWTAQLQCAPLSQGSRLPGDKIILPPSALEQLLSASASAASSSVDPAPAFDPWNPRAYHTYRQNVQEKQQQLPQPLTFRLINPESGRIVYAGIREFSADEGQIVLSPFLYSALGLKEPELQSDGAGKAPQGDGAALDGPRVTVHFRELSKGSYVKLRPLEAGYDVEDWKALLEQYMRSNFTTLTKGEVLEVPGEAAMGSPEVFRFLVDEFKPDAEGICVVDTDLEVDIEALNEEQARETVKRIAAKYQNGTTAHAGSSQGGDIDIFKEHTGHVLPGEYVDYQLPSWPREQPLEIELSRASDTEDLDLLISPLSAYQRGRPRADAYVFADWEDRPIKRLKLQPTNVELEGAEALYVSVYAYKLPDVDDTGETQDQEPRHFTIRAKVVDAQAQNTHETGMQFDQPPNEGDVKCKNCNQWIPGRTLMLHENFCLRNNILCPQGCGQIFQKRSPAYQQHWHCAHDTHFGSTPLTLQKHNNLYHPPSPLTCTRCPTVQTFSSIPLLAQHHTTTCPSKPILCRFCHLAVPQEGDSDTPNPEALLSGLTPHELLCGARTTECHLCNRIVRLRDMDTHLKGHDLDRKSRSRPRLCRNVYCGNTLDGANRAGSTRAGIDSGNDVGLCKPCYAPLYVTMYDPEGKALKRRVERRYLTQLMNGCGKAWCQNAFCKTGRKNAGLSEEGTVAKTAVPMVRDYVQGVAGGDTPLHFCVEEGTQRRRERAGMLKEELEGRLGRRAFGFEWCVAAMEAEEGELERARVWLENWAPRVEEERMA
ncbi:Ubiquitin fusion degradation protein 1 [Sphaceloma murrayae]|uniref:Ubiquitin fusion degradation protein 1 n=1 Tax=Sphaceloma murrayae TaxID=2082308 RepID=A0A2K1QKQ8_9PEZI|nr:Ubiquitin fusion degradation protein 1 [Sphaceloma murrayae]